MGVLFDVINLAIRHLRNGKTTDVAEEIHGNDDESGEDTKVEISKRELNRILMELDNLKVSTKSSLKILQENVK